MYDLIIIGGSAAATAAGVYAARRGLNFKILTKEFGGEVATSGEIGNWPGIPMTDGVSLAQQFKDHLAYYNVEPEQGVEVVSVTKQPDGNFCISTKHEDMGTVPILSLENSGLQNRGSSVSQPRQSEGEIGTGDKMGAPATGMTCDYVAKAVILATGVHPRELGVPGEKEYRNKGVSYCTTCDGPIFKDKVVVTIGGGNSALESALMLADIASHVYVVNKNATFKGEQVLMDNLKTKKNVEIITNAKTKEILGDKFVTTVRYTDQVGADKDLSVSGVFVHIGMVPNSYLAPADTVKNQFGEIKVNANCETNIPGLYAAGDVSDVPFKQIVIAAGQGCIATLAAVQYLNRLSQ